jgi:hypothetical protein
LGFDTRTEAEIKTPFSVVRADILVTKPQDTRKRLVELKVFSPANTTISGIRDALRTTLKKYAQLSGYLPKG